MKNIQFNWITDSGIKIFAQTWEPDLPTSEPVICLVHGLGEHSSRYVELPSFLVDHSYKVIAFDLRGHGKSEGKRGHINSYTEFMEDISRLLIEANKRFPDNELFLYGHSMGGNLVLNYVLRNKPNIKGAIVTGPWLKLTKPPNPALVRLAKVLDKIWPTFTTHNGLRSEDLSIDSDKQVNTIKDDLLHPWISVHAYLELAQAGCWALEHAGNFEHPLLILHGEADKVTSPEGSREFHIKSGKQSTLSILSNFYHGIHGKPGNEEIFSVILEWLEHH